MQRQLYKVIKKHKASFQETMIATKVDREKMGKEDPKMPGWYWCRGQNRMEAWVPETHLEINSGEAMFNQPYNSIEDTAMFSESKQYLGESIGWTGFPKKN